MQFSFATKEFSSDSMLIEFWHDGVMHSFIMNKNDRNNLILEMKKVIDQLEMLKDES